MPMPGMPPGCPPGWPEDVQYIPRVRVALGALAVKCRPRLGYAGFFALMLDGRCTACKYCPDDQDTEFVSPHDPSYLDHHVSLLPFGNNPAPVGYYDLQHLAWMQEHANRILVAITGAVQYFAAAPVNSVDWAGATITGVDRVSNIGRVDDRPQWGKWTYDLVDVSGTLTLTVYRDGTAVMSGTGTSGTTWTLTAQNSSGLAASVAVTYSADETGTILFARWPASAQVHYDSSALSFPRTAEGTVDDDGVSNTLQYRSARLNAGGTWYVVSRSVDENGNVSTNTTAETVTIAKPPEAGGRPAYVSGGYAATVIGWTASATAGVRYNVYDSGVVDGATDTLPFIDLFTPVGDTNLLQYTLPAITAGYTGLRWVLVRAYHASGTAWEEGNLQYLELEYVSGVVVAKRPNSPASTLPATVDGPDLTAYFTYQTADQEVAPTHFRLSLWLAGDSPSYTPVNSIAISEADLLGGVYTGSITGGLSTGLYYYNIRAYNADNFVDDGNTRAYGPVLLTETAPAAPEDTVTPGY